MTFGVMIAERETHFGSVVTSLYVGEPALMLLIFTGWSFIQLRKTSRISRSDAVVLMDPAAACERDTSCPPCSRAALYEDEYPLVAE